MAVDDPGHGLVGDAGRGGHVPDAHRPRTARGRHGPWAARSGAGHLCDRSHPWQDCERSQHVRQEHATSRFHAPKRRAAAPPRRGGTLGRRTETARTVIGWSDDALDLRIEVDGDGMARMTRLTRRLVRRPPQAPPSGLPSATRRPAARRCRCSTSSWPARAGVVGRRYCESEAGQPVPLRRPRRGPAMKAPPASWRELRVDLDDPVTGLRAEVFYRILAGQGGACAPGSAWRTGPQAGDGRVGDLVPVRRPVQRPRRPRLPTTSADLDVLWAENDWMAEGRWQSRALRDALPDLEPSRSWRRPAGPVRRDEPGHLVLGRLPADGRP